MLIWIGITCPVERGRFGSGRSWRGSSGLVVHGRARSLREPDPMDRETPGADDPFVRSDEGSLLLRLSDGSTRSVSTRNSHCSARAIHSFGLIDDEAALRHLAAAERYLWLWSDHGRTLLESGGSTVWSLCRRHLEGFDRR